MTDTNPEPFVPYRERPPLDKGEIITWRELESGMLFEPGVLSDPRRRRVRGTPIPVEANESYIIGSEDLDGTPKGGVEGCNDDFYRRTYDENGQAVYVIDYELSPILHLDEPLEIGTHVAWKYDPRITGIIVGFCTIDNSVDPLASDNLTWNGSIVRLDGEPFRSDAIPAHVTFHFPVETAQLMRVPDGADEHRSEV
jgi:hypothetical protein